MNSLCHLSCEGRHQVLGVKVMHNNDDNDISTGELGYDGPLYDGFLHMTDDMLDPNPMHIKYSSYVYDGFCL